MSAIRYQDARDLKAIVYTEYNIEGNPEQTFIDLVLEIKPTQVTLVPDAIDAHIKCGMEYRKT
jgi:pyridoxine 5-phosphate synthase